MSVQEAAAFVGGCATFLAGWLVGRTVGRHEGWMQSEHDNAQRMLRCPCGIPCLWDEEQPA